MATLAGAGMALSPHFVFAGTPVSDRKIRIGIVGGRFGTSFYFHEHPNCIVEAVSDLRDDAGFQHKEATVETYKQPQWWQTDMLPQPLRHNSGHDGSHTFITHAFIDALINEHSPEVNIHEALAYTAPGIVAHQSALKNGECLKVPGFD